MINYYDSQTRDAHTVKASDAMDEFLYSRMKELGMPKFKRYFIHLLQKDGFKADIDNI